MDASCNLDVELAHQISALLRPPSPQQVQEYFDELFKARKSVGLKIRHNDEFGKGLYADVEFGEGELVLRDQMLVGAQHTSNKVDCLVCSHCFRFIGSVELQIGRKLYLQDLGLSSNAECASNSLDEEGDLLMEDHNDSSSCSSSDLKKRISLPKETVVSLMNGAIALPCSEQFSLPSAMPCPGGCGEAYYCSKLCADMDWELFHSLLCTGESSASLCQEALLKFIEHANETNDIFLLSAKAIAFTILQYRKLKVAHLGNQKLKQCSALGGMETSEFSLLLEAWKPMSMGFKRRWWECIALPEDVDCCDEASFRMQIKDLASMSLQLLKQAIFDKECAALFTLEIYGHIIGMFELNNLDLVVASPVEDYFLYIDDLLHAEKEVAERITRPFLDALGEDYSVCCQGSAFFPIQSCINHSCYPNAKAFKREEDRDGQATIIAIRPISKGEEITISYIDEDQSLEDRRRQLADYGFRCRCPKCKAEEHHEPSLF